MKKRIVATAAVTALVAPVTLALASAPAEANVVYKNCTALHKDFKHGVAKSRAAAKKQIKHGYKMPAYGKHARAVYWANYRSMDRDKDGTACEA